MKQQTSLLLVLISFLLIQSCDHPEVVLTDLNLIRQEDIAKIDSMISANSLGQPDTTENGARYFIFHNGDQTQETIKPNDIATFDFTGYYLEDSIIIHTTIPAIAAIDTISTSTAPSFTYSESGWSLRYVSVTAQFLTTGGTALIEAIAASFKEMVPGDRVVVFLPSDQCSFTGSVTKSRVIFYDITIKDDGE